MIIDDGYPKGIERWRGLPLTGIDSALTWSNGNLMEQFIYFETNLMSIGYSM